MTKFDLRNSGISNAYIGLRNDQISMGESLSGSILSDNDYWSDNTTVSGKDEIIGSESGDNLFVRAMQGDDVIYVSSGILNWVTGNMGEDTISLYASADGKEDGNIKGANDNDTINVIGGTWGESGRPINGNQGNDTLNIWTGATCTALRGGIGDDTFNIYGGVAVAHGDPGRDTYNLWNDGFVRIEDYNRAEDFINTSNLTGNSTFSIVNWDNDGTNDLAIYNESNNVVCVLINTDGFN